MTILAFNFEYGTNGDHKPVAAKFSTDKQALRQRNDWFIPASPEQLAFATEIAPTDKMVELLGRLTGSTPTHEDRSTLAERIFEACEALPLDQTPEGITNMETPTTSVKVKKIAPGVRALPKNGKATKPAAAKKAAPAPKANGKAPKAAPAPKVAKKADGAGRGRTSALAGNKLVANVKLDADKSPINPRRKDSHGYKSLAIIIKAGKTGITTEDYLKAGGRMNDLHWDIDHSTVIATPAK